MVPLLLTSVVRVQIMAQIKWSLFHTILFHVPENEGTLIKILQYQEGKNGMSRYLGH